MATPIRSVLIPLVALLVACMREEGGDVAGISVGSGNPGKVKVGFRVDGSPAAFTGRLEIYGATQIPVPELKPDPLLALPVASASEYLLSADAFAALPDSVWPYGSSLGDTAFRFNLVAVSGDRGAILMGFTYWKTLGCLSQAEAGCDSSAAPAADLAPLVAAEAHLMPHSLLESFDTWLFILGTGYIAKVDPVTGRIQFPVLPEGEHDLTYFSIWKKGLGPTSAFDTLSLYDVSRPLRTGTVEEVEVDSISFRFPTPEVYKEW